MVLLTWIFGLVGTFGVAGTVAAFIFFPTVAAPIAEKVVQILLGCKWCLVAMAFVAVALGSFWYGRHGEYAKGYASALAQIASEDADALKRAKDMRSVWQECRQKDGQWDQSTGECK